MHCSILPPFCHHSEYFHVVALAPCSVLQDKKQKIQSLLSRMFFLPWQRCYLHTSNENKLLMFSSVLSVTWSNMCITPGSVQNLSSQLLDCPDPGGFPPSLPSLEVIYAHKARLCLLSIEAKVEPNLLPLPQQHRLNCQLCSWDMRGWSPGIPSPDLKGQWMQSGHKTQIMNFHFLGAVCAAGHFCKHPDIKCLSSPFPGEGHFQREMEKLNSSYYYFITNEKTCKCKFCIQFLKWQCLHPSMSKTFILFLQKTALDRRKHFLSLLGGH